MNKHKAGVALIAPVLILLLGGQGNGRPMESLKSQTGEKNLKSNGIKSYPDEKIPVATKKSLKKGLQVFKKSLAAMGDPAKIKAVTSMHMKIQAQQQGMTIDMEGFILYPDKFKIILNLPMGVVTMIINGDSSIADTPQGKFPMPPEQAKSMKSNIMRDPFYIWKYIDQYQIQFNGMTKFSDKEAYDLIISGMEDSFHFYIDPSNYNIIGSQYQALTQAGPTTVQDVYSDFRQEGEFKFSFKTVTMNKGNIESEAVVKEAKFNVEMKEDLFKTE